VRRWAELVAMIAGIVVGYALAAAIAAPASVDPTAMPGPGSGVGRTPLQGIPATTTTTGVVPSTEQGASTYLVWATGGLPDGLGRSLEEMLGSVSVVEGDPVELEVGGGSMVPLDALAIDPAAHAPFDPEGALAELRPGTVVLGESSARLRRAEVGEVLTIGGNGYEVAAIAPDEVVAGAEVVFAKGDESTPVRTERFALVATELTRPRFEEQVRALYTGPAPLRIRAEGETPWLRHGDAVLPQVFIKQALGEFSYTGRSGISFTQDPEYIAANIVIAEAPILGEVRCHRVVAEMLAGAMTQLVEQGLGHLVDPGGFAGCWNPRYIRAAAGTAAGVSRHAWGAAVDLNASTNPVGSAGTQDPRLVEVMAEWGFTWGGLWLVPDPMHFEYGIDPG
jgi:hypothetical protein